MRIERNAKIDINELNNLLKSIGWGLNSTQKLDDALKLSWGWITARDEAIEYYKLSFTMQKSPRKIDGLISMFQIYEIKKDYLEALSTLDIILSVYEKDYGITDGEEIQPYLKDKERIIIHEKLIFS